MRPSPPARKLEDGRRKHTLTDILRYYPFKDWSAQLSPRTWKLWDSRTTLWLTLPVSDNADSDASVIVVGCVRSHVVPAPSFVDSAISPRQETVTNKLLDMLQISWSASRIEMDSMFFLLVQCPWRNRVHIFLIDLCHHCRLWNWQARLNSPVFFFSSSPVMCPKEINP